MNVISFFNISGNYVFLNIFVHYRSCARGLLWEKKSKYHKIRIKKINIYIYNLVLSRISNSILNTGIKKKLVLILVLKKRKTLFRSPRRPSVIFVSPKPKSNFTFVCSPVHYETQPLQNDSLLLDATLKCTAGSWPGERKCRLISEWFLFPFLLCQHLDKN